MNRKKTHELGQEACSKGFPGGSVVKYLPSMQEMWVRSLGWDDALENEMTTPLLYSCLGNPTDRGAWRAAVHEVTKESDTTSPLYNKKKHKQGASREVQWLGLHLLIQGCGLHPWSGR